MNKEFVPYEIAVELKELGFDEECFAGYDNEGNLYYSGKNMDCLKAPLWQQAFRWVQERGYNAVIYKVEGGFWDWDIQDDHQEEDEIFHDLPLFGSYENARESCLKKMIEIVKSEE